MIDTGTPNDYFEVVNRALGWGDPGRPEEGKRAIWFIGIEEASRFDAAAVNSYRSRAPIEPEEEPNVGNRSPIQSYTAKIVAPVSDLGTSKGWECYRRERMWRPGSQLCQVNLYPLGKPHVKSWPEDYKHLFGFGPDERQQYRERVRYTRFPMIRGEWRRCYPQATICFGKEMWDMHRELFELPAESQSQHFGKHGEIHVFDHEHVVLTPFFAYWHMNDVMAKYVTETLKGWRVEIP